MTVAAILNQPLSFPPGFTPVAAGTGSAFDRAVAAACAGSGAATLVWAQRLDLFDCAVVFEPDRPLALALPVLYVCALATADSLGALGPPNKAVTFGWPDRIAVDGAGVGGVRLAWPDGAAADAVPDWLVGGVTLRMRFPEGQGGGDSDPGRSPDRTVLHEEGFGEVEVPALVESFSRHLLHWTTRWLEDGFDAVALEWLGHLPLDVRDGPVRHGLDPNGDLLLLEPGNPRPRRRALVPALSAPGWSL